VGVVSEVESLALLDDSAHPFAEVGVADAPLPLLVLVEDQLRKIAEVQVLILCPKVTEDVLHRNEAVIVTVKVKEGFSYRGPVVGELGLDETLQSCQLSFDITL
jgi:hypothetical protein